MIGQYHIMLLHKNTAKQGTFYLIITSAITFIIIVWLSLLLSQPLSLFSDTSITSSKNLFIYTAISFILLATSYTQTHLHCTYRSIPVWLALLVSYYIFSSVSLSLIHPVNGFLSIYSFMGTFLLLGIYLSYKKMSTLNAVIIFFVILISTNMSLLVLPKQLIFTLSHTYILLFLSTISCFICASYFLYYSIKNRRLPIILSLLFYSITAIQINYLSKQPLQQLEQLYLFFYILSIPFICYISFKYSCKLYNNYKYTRTLSNTLPIGIFYTDVTGHIHFINKQGQKLLALADNMPQQSWFQYIKPAQLESIKKIWQQHLHQKTFQFECLICPPQEKERWLLVHVMNNKELKHSSHYVVTLTDISVLKYMTQIAKNYTDELEELVFVYSTALEESEKKYNQSIQTQSMAEKQLEVTEKNLISLQHFLPEAMITLNETQHILAFNQGAEAIFHYSAEEAIGKPLSLLFSEQKKDLYEKQFETFCFNHASKEASRKYSILIGQRKNKEPCSLKGYIFKYHSTHQPLFGLILTDVTQQHSIENTLRHDLSTYQHLFYYASDAFIVFNLQGKILYANQRSSLLFGYALETLHTKQWQDLYKSDKSSLLESFFSTFERKYHFTLKNQVLKTKNNNEVIVDLTGVFTHLEAEPTIFISYRVSPEPEKKNQDLPQKDMADKHLIAQCTQHLNAMQEELIKAREIKNSFLANVSHELRTPLNTILVTSEGLQEEAFGSLNEKQQKYLTNIHTSGLYLLGVVNDLLDLSKIEAGKISLQLDQVFIDELCRSCLHLIAPTANKKSLVIHYDCNQSNTMIIVDIRRFKQILVNLLSNAVKFTPESGQITLSVNLNTIHQTVSFSVTDTGIGIAAEKIPSLFKPFTQLDDSLSRQYEGTGLGLVIAKKLVELHLGTIQLSSQLNHGSCFTVTVPLLENTHDTNPPVAEQSEIAVSQKIKSYGEHPTHIVLAEDNQANIIALLPYLEYKGYKVDVIMRGNEVIPHLEATHPTLLLLDIQMPEKDGLTITKELRQHPDFKALPIIAITSFAMSEDKQKCLDAGVDDYMSKPLKLKKLVENIENLLSKRYH